MRCFVDQVTFVVVHFNDPRISSADLKDLLLQSISVLVQYKEYLLAFESNEAAIHILPTALISAFDQRSWIPVTNILLRLCRGSGFGSSKHGESSSSVVFQVNSYPLFDIWLFSYPLESLLTSFCCLAFSISKRLLREACINDKDLFSAFLNRLFNTLSWTMTEFSVSMREMQEKFQVWVIWFLWKCDTFFSQSY